VQEKKIEKKKKKKNVLKKNISGKQRARLTNRSVDAAFL